MPDDLLRFVSGPPGYSLWWLWLALGLIMAVIGWYGAIFLATLPSRRLRTMPVVRDAHARLLRQRFAARVRGILRQHRAGELTDAAASAALSQTLRSFLHQATGRRAQFMQLKDIAASDLATAAPVLEALGDAQFSAAPTADINRLGSDTEDVIRSWV